MTKEDIVNKLTIDRNAINHLLDQKFTKEGSVALQSKLDYIEALLQRINKGS